MSESELRLGRLYAMRTDNMPLMNTHLHTAKTMREQFTGMARVMIAQVNVRYDKDPTDPSRQLALVNVRSPGFMYTRAQMDTGALYFVSQSTALRRMRPLVGTPSPCACMVLVLASPQGRLTRGCACDRVLFACRCSADAVAGHDSACFHLPPS
jgi:hypothetical protein